MIRTFLLSLFIGVAALGLHGRTATEVFTTAPDRVVRLIPQSTRLDMVDYFNFGSDHPSENFFGGSARMTAISDAVVDFQIDEGVNMQIAVLPTKTDTIFAVVTTLAIPSRDSSIKFYSKDWQLLAKQPFTMPAYEEWLTDEGKANKVDITLNLPFMPVSASFTTDGSTLVLTNEAPQFLGERQTLPFDKWLIESKTYDVKSAQFIPSK